MLTFPQLATGALSQFPVVRTHFLRTVVHTAADLSTVKIADPGAECTLWRMQYSGLSDQEIEHLRDFFQEAEGSLNGFTFLDPNGNLLAWSDDLSNTAWDGGPLLTKARGRQDPEQGNSAWHVENAGGGPQSLCQSLSGPTDYVYCFSLYAKSTVPTTVTMLAGHSRYDQTVGAVWRRLHCTTVPASPTFGIELPAGAAVDVFGLQVEAQAYPSMYRRSTNGGVYSGARLRDDALSFTTTGVNCHSTTVNIVHANHL